jgi:beta-glucosidase
MPSLFRLRFTLFLALFATSAWLSADEATTTPTVYRAERHPGFMSMIKAMNGDIDVVCIGDSITEGWRKAGKAIWDKNFAPLKALNLGLGGDRTQGVLYRVQNGQLDGYKAKLFMLMIGTNNRDPAQDVSRGIKAIITEIQTRQPQAKILLLGLFPRGATSADPLRIKNEQVNANLSQWDDGNKLRYLDIGQRFLAADKSTLSKDIMPDLLHPNANGYQIWADAVMPTITEMLGAQ